MYNTANEVLIMVRSILRDNDSNALRFTDRELLDKLSYVQNNLISDFKENIHYITQEINEAEFTLPYKIAHIYSCKLDNKPLKYSHISTALHALQKTLFHLRDTTYRITHFNLQRATLEIYASVYADILHTPEDKLTLDIQFNKCLALGVVCEILLIETNSNNAAKLETYTKIYEQTKATIKTQKNNNLAKSTIHTK